LIAAFSLAAEFDNPSHSSTPTPSLCIVWAPMRKSLRSIGSKIRGTFYREL
jgi:hypothetical protein